MKDNVQGRTLFGTADVESLQFSEIKQKPPSSSSYKKLFTVIVLLATILGSTIVIHNFHSVLNGSRSPIGDLIFLVRIF